MDFGVVCDSICFWDVPGDVLAAPASALWRWKGVILSFSLSLSVAVLRTDSVYAEERRAGVPSGVPLSQWELSLLS